MDTNATTATDTSSGKSSFINLQNKDGDTAMHIAVRHGNRDIVETLIRCENLELDIQNNDLDTVLHISDLAGSNGGEAGGKVIPKELRIKLTRLAVKKEAAYHDMQHSNSSSNSSSQSHDSIYDHVIDSSQSKNEGESVDQSDNFTGNHVIQGGKLEKKQHAWEETNDTKNDNNNNNNNNNVKRRKCIGNIANRIGNTLMHVFASQNDMDSMEAILSLPCTRTKIKNEDHETSLHVAVRNQSLALIHPLIKEVEYFSVIIVFIVLDE